MLAETDTREVGDHYVVLRSAMPAEGRVGIYARGGCHLRAMFACAPLIQDVLRGACCIFHDGGAPRCRSDLELQTLQNLPREWVTPVIEKLRLRDDFFQPALFEDTFTIPGDNGSETFSKNVIVLHIGMDSAGRTLYRHRKHGFLVDPGGGWLQSLQSMDLILKDLSVVRWFRESFECVGMISVESFVENYTKIIEILRRKTKAHIVFFNTLGVEPGTLTHNYQFVKQPLHMRWREFNIALWELSRKLDFPVVDLDRVLKCAGIRAQTEFAHFHPRQNVLVAREAFQVLSDLGVFSE
jgi:hypothetical protein